MSRWQQNNQRTTSRAIAIIRRIPFTRMVALTGSAADGRATKKSDIDFFVQVKVGHIWTTRLLITVMLQLLGLRRTGTKIAGKICLNWFAIFNAPDRQSGRVYRVLWEETQTGFFKSVLENSLSGYMGKMFEKFVNKLQISRIKKDPRTHQPGSQVRYGDTELGFHPSKARSD